MPHFNTISDPQWAKVKYEIAIELAKFGVFYDIQDNPFSVTFSDSLAVDSTLTEASVLEKVTFIQRADALVQLAAGKAATVAILSQPSVPHISNSQP